MNRAADLIANQMAQLREALPQRDGGGAGGGGGGGGGHPTPGNGLPFHPPSGGRSSVVRGRDGIGRADGGHLGAASHVQAPGVAQAGAAHAGVAHAGVAHAGVAGLEGSLEGLLMSQEDMRGKAVARETVIAELRVAKRTLLERVEALQGNLLGRGGYPQGQNASTGAGTGAGAGVGGPTADGTAERIMNSLNLAMLRLRTGDGPTTTQRGDAESPGGGGGGGEGGSVRSDGHGEVEPAVSMEALQVSILFRFCFVFVSFLFRFVSFCIVLFRFVSFLYRFVSFWFVLLRFVSFCFVFIWFVLLCLVISRVCISAPPPPTFRAAPLTPLTPLTPSYSPTCTLLAERTRQTHSPNALAEHTHSPKTMPQRKADVS